MPSDYPKSLYQGTLKLGTIAVDCHVLEGGRRVITQRGVERLLLREASSGHFKRYLSRIPKDIQSLDVRPLLFDAGKPGIAHGYEAEDVIDICDAYVGAWQTQKLQKSQIPIAERALSIIRACGKIGIIALIDEATGYQKVRAEDDLRVRVAAYLKNIGELEEHVTRFPIPFWEHGARLLGIPYRKGLNPQALASVIRDYIYKPILGPDVAKILKERNPHPSHGTNHHQWLQPVALKKLNEKVTKIIGLMEISEGWSPFKYRLQRLNREPGLQIDWIRETE